MKTGDKFTMHGTEYSIVAIDGNIATCEDYNKHYFTYFSVSVVRDALGNN